MASDEVDVVNRQGTRCGIQANRLKWRCPIEDFGVLAEAKVGEIRGKFKFPLDPPLQKGEKSGLIAPFVTGSGSFLSHN